MTMEIVTKAVKAAVVIGGVMGIDISPEHADAIIKGVGSIFAVAYTIEAWLKKKGS